MTDQTTTPGSDDVVHWWSPTGATHAVVDVTDWHGSAEPDLVTCPTCLLHIAESKPKIAGVRINDRKHVHVRQVGSLRPKTRCGVVLRAPNRVEDVPDVDALPPDVKRCRLCFAGSARADD